MQEAKKKGKGILLYLYKYFSTTKIYVSNMVAKIELSLIVWSCLFVKIKIILVFKMRF